MGLILALIVVSREAGGAPVLFTGEIEGAARSAAVEETILDEILYVSIVDIAEQLGGSASQLTTRVRVDIAGSTAWLQADDTRVNAFRIFTLSQPARRIGGEFFLATVDVPVFFEKAFRVDLLREAAETPSSAAPDSSAPAAATLGAAETSAPEPAAAPTSPVQVIVIDPGHGGFETGIEGHESALEKTIVLDIANRTKAALEAKISQSVVLTRDEDIALNEAQRAALVQNSSADLLIAIHAGSSLSPKVRGTTLIYESASVHVHGRPTGELEQARRLARFLAESLKEVSAVPMRGIDGAETRSMAHPGTPSVMIEIGRLTNSEDAAALRDESTRAAIAAAIADGVARFVGAEGAAP